MVALAQSPHIAVVGTGIAALTCAREIVRRSGGAHSDALAGARVTLCTSRSKMATQVGPKNQYVPRNGEPFYDYGIQYLQPKGEAFTAEVRRWAELGFCTRLGPGEIGTVSARDGFRPFEEGDGAGGSFVGNGGMGILAANLIRQTGEEYAGCLDVLSGFPDQKNRVVGLSKTPSGWMLHTKDGRRVGPFDAVVGGFAQHCLTDPFLLSAGAPAKGMLDCLRRVESNQLIVMQVSFDPPLGRTFTAAHVQGEDALSFVANNSRKPHQDGHVRPAGRELWTLISSAAFGEREFNTNKKGYRRVAEKEMLSALQRALGVGDLAAHHPRVNRINHWEDGVSANAPPNSRGCLFDAAQGLGWCGDFCTEHPNVEGAAASGLAMARTLAAYFEGAAPADAAHLPARVPWAPRAPDSTGGAALVDIGAFPHDRLRLPAKFTHTDLVPSSVDGYDKQTGRGAGATSSSGRRHQGRSSNRGRSTGGSRRGRGRGRGGRGRNSRGGRGRGDA